MKKKIPYMGALFFLMTTTFAHAHSGSVSISSPSNNQTIVVEALPINIIVEGTITHGSPGNVNDQRACVKLDGGSPTCEPNYVGGLGNVSSRNYSITVPINSEGQHTLQAFSANSHGDHSGMSALITINIVLAITTCDEKDPPAYANEYLNSLSLPQEYATYRGQIIRVIAFNSSNGAYGSCHYDHALVRSDVDSLLVQLGF